MFSWIAQPGDLDYWLDVGSALGIGNHTAGVVQGTGKFVTQLPCTGSIYVRLWTRQASGYLPPEDRFFVPNNFCTQTGDSRERLLHPQPSDVITSPSVVFFRSTETTYNPQVNLLVGSTLGGGDYFNGLIADPVSLSNIPCNGQPLFARLLTGSSGFHDYVFRRASSCSSIPQAQILTPAPGKRLPGSPTEFSWTAPSGALDFWFDFGTSKGSGNILGRVVSGNSVEISDIPCNGSTLYARLWTRTAAGYLPPVDYVFQAQQTCDAPPVLTDPSAFALPGSVVTFKWSGGSAILDYWLDVGPQPRTGTYFGGAISGTSKTVSGIPCGIGQPVYVSLFGRTSSGYLAPVIYNFFTGPCGSNTRAILTSPVRGQVLSPGNFNFTWTPGDNAQDYWLDVGASQGQGSLFGGIVSSTSRQVNIAACPGPEIWVRLWTRTAGSWQPPFDYSFKCTGPDNRAKLTAPTLGSLLASSTTFSWSVGTGAQDYWLDVGTAQGQGNIFGGVVATTSRQVTNIPSGAIWVRLWTRIGGIWQPPIDYQFNRP
jgi:hypothetical protein